MIVLAADTTVTSPWFTAMVALIVGAGGGTGLATFFRVSADRGKVVIEAAQGAVIVQTGVIEALRAELNRVKDEVGRLQEENRQLRQRVSAVEQDTDPGPGR